MAYSRDLPKMARSTVALLIEISVILITGDRDWRFGMVWLVWGGEGQMTSKFIHEEISIMDYNGLSGGGVHHGLSLTVKDPRLSYKAIHILFSDIGSISTSFM